MFFGKSTSIHSSSWFSSGFKALKASGCFIFWSSIVFICFSNAKPIWKYVNLACSILLLWSDSKIFSPVRNSYFSTLPDKNAVIFAISLLVLSCSFSSLVLWLIAMINFYTFSRRFLLKCEELSDPKVVSITKRMWFCIIF